MELFRTSTFTQFICANYKRFTRFNVYILGGSQTENTSKC